MQRTAAMKPARRLTMSVALMSLACASSHAAEWTAPLPTTGLEPIQVQRVLPGPTGYVLATQAGDTPYWIEIEAGTTPTIHRAEFPQFSGRYFDPARLLDSGEGHYLAQLDEPDGECRLAVIDAASTVQRVAAASGCYSASAASTFAAATSADAAGGLWLARSNSLDTARLQADGAMTAIPLPADATAIVHYAALHADTASYALYRSGESTRLAKIDPRRVQWSWQPGLPDIRIQQVVVAGNDDAWVIGIQSTVAGAPGPLYLARVSPAGSTRWQQLYSDRAAVLLHAQALPGDRLALAASEAVSAPRSLHLFDAQGGSLWNRSTDNESFLGFVLAPRETALGAATPVAYFVGTDDRIGAIELVDAQGMRLRRITASSAAPALTAQLHDGSLVHVDSDGFNPPQTLRHYAADGTPLTTPALEQLVPASGQLLQAAVAGGDALLVHQAGDTQSVTLQTLDAAGAPAWTAGLGVPSGRVVNTLFDRLSGQQGVLATAADRVCVGPLRSYYADVSFSYRELLSWVQCFRRSDGAAAVSPPSPALQGLDFLAMDLQADGDLVVASLACAQDCAETVLRRDEFTAQGELRSQAQSEALGIGDFGRQIGSTFEGRNALATIDGQGQLSLLIGAPEGQLSLLQMAADGQRTRSPVAGDPAGILLRMQALAQGGWLLHSWSEDGHLLRAIGAQGQLRWSRLFSGALSHYRDPRHPVLVFTTSGDRVLLSHHSVDGERAGTRIEALDAGTGQTLWQSARQEPGATVSAEPARLENSRGVLALEIDATQRLAVVVRDRPGAPMLSLLALDDGAVLAQRDLNCIDAADCAVAAARLADDSSLRLFADRSVQRVDLDSSLRTAPLAQPAVTGTWYDPATTGQGLLVDYSAATGDLIAAWFSYADDQGYGVDALRWYTLGGRAGADDDEVTLDIYSNRGGQFDQPLPTASEIVGQARLVLRDCNELVLSYRFESGELAGIGGEIALQRLTPTVFACERADGLFEPAQPAQPSLASGYSAGHSGAWYEPASSGQGLLFDVRPPALDGEQPGLLVAGWFTYDRAGQDDDPTAQHWFLLQGNLAETDGGVAQLEVYRASNGSFDTRPTANTHRVGVAELQFLGCDRARLRYRFDDSDLAGNFAGTQGEIALIKLLACAD